MARRRAPARPVSELQTSGPRLVRQAQRDGAVALTRYGKTVAYLISPAVRQRHEQLDQAANRALWAIDIKRGLRDLEQGDVTEWDEVYAALGRELAQ